MKFSIALLDLEQLSGLTGLSELSGDTLDARLRAAFAFLPEASEFTVDDRGVLHVEVPNAPEDAKSQAERHAKKAARAASNGDYAKARKLFDQALSLDPTLTSARRDLAMLCSEIGDAEAAKDHLIDVLRISPDDAWAYVILANHYAKAENNPGMALTLLERAVKIAPEDPYAHNSLAGVLLEQGDFPAALGHFDSALRTLPTLANALYGRAIIRVRQANFPEAETAFEAFFRGADLSDPRNATMVDDARSTFIKVENIIANDRQHASAKTIQVLRARAEELSGYPIVDNTADKLPGHIGGTVRMAWKYGRDHHQLLLRGGDYPEILRQHLTAHELHHLIFESQARTHGVNRWFTAADIHRQVARNDLAPSLEKIRQSGAVGDSLDGLFNYFFSGVTSLLYNCPIDMRIERLLRSDYPALKQAQFCGVAQMAHEARLATFSEKVRATFPAPMLRLNDVLNSAYALFVDDLFDGATAFSTAYRPLPAFREGRQLYQLWQELDEQTPIGEEWRMVDAFTEKLGLTGWFAWRRDG